MRRSKYSLVQCQVILVVASAATNTALAHERAPLLSSSQGKTLIFKSPVDERGVEKILALIESTNVAELRITSWGGNELLAAELGYVIKVRGIAVTADGYCVSACVNILLSSSKAQIKRDTFVALHPSGYSVYEWAEGSATEIGKVVKADTEKSYRAVQALKLNGGKMKFIRSAFFNAQPRCASITVVNGLAKSQVYYERPLWIPTRRALEDIGIRIEASWPNSPQQAFAFATRFLKPETGLSFGHTADAGHSKVSRLARCTT